jgi:hypothetical protein
MKRRPYSLEISEEAEKDFKKVHGKAIPLCHLLSSCGFHHNDNRNLPFK